jgi:regulator of protease activity HflC (stomatin/prohibitin superfamily)
MRDIVKGVLAARVPVATYVAPGGARAASAGTYILYASPIAAMAPGTNLGAATPVAIGGPDACRRLRHRRVRTRTRTRARGRPRRQSTTMSRKQMHDSAAYIRGLAQLHGRNVEWAERAVREAVSLPAQDALAQHVIDLVATDVPDLARKLDGRKVRTAAGERVLATAGATIIMAAPDWRTRFLAIITHPSIALILLTVGFYGLVFEVMNPGMVLPGVVGAIAILIGMYALQLLPTNYAGVALVLLGLSFIVAEAFVPAYGSLGIGGVIAFVVGAMMLIESDVPGFGVPGSLIADVGDHEPAVPVRDRGGRDEGPPAPGGHRPRADDRKPRHGGRRRRRRRLGARAQRALARALHAPARERPDGARDEQGRIGSDGRPDPHGSLRIVAIPEGDRLWSYLPNSASSSSILLVLVATSIRVLREYERGVVFMLGRFWKVKGPGLVILIPVVQQMVRVGLRTVVLDVPPQDVITRDNVSVKVNAVVYFRVVDPEKAIIQVERYLDATSQLAQTTLRAVLGKHELDQLLAEREKLNLDIQRVLDVQTDAWGIKVSNVEIKHVDLNETMIRAIARQAEAERERRAKVIHAEGELQASEKLLQAAQMLAQAPQAMQLRYLQTLGNIAGDKSTTIVFPLPMDLLSALKAGVGSDTKP